MAKYFNYKQIEEAVEDILDAVGEKEPLTGLRDGLKDTPLRVTNAYAELLSGMGQDETEPLKTQFDEDVYNDFILVKDIDFYSLCEHHMLPFFGKVHIAYVPSNGKVTGLSKLARCVEIVSRRLQVQERITEQIHEAIMKALEPKSVFVLVEAQHMCMSMRGIQKQGAVTITQQTTGFDTFEISNLMSRIKA